MFSKRCSDRRGFSLVELSIVLVILGLLTGGILTGQSLIKAAELRAITTEFAEYKTAVNIFQGKYFALPGDMTNATSFWGDNTTHCSDGSPDGNPGTCNGNGDGRIDDEAGAAGEESEGVLLWQHLANAGLIQGEYTGLTSPAATDGHTGGVVGESLPASRYAGGCYSIDNDVSGGGADFGLEFPDNLLQFGEHTTWGQDCDGELLVPQDAWNVDKKIDDGKPGRGSIIARNWDMECAAATGNTDFDADYNYAEDSVECSLYFLNFPK
jgi:prepilin-type N-terminal cleavage/methylation domain-containing protein